MLAALAVVYLALPFNGDPLLITSQNGLILLSIVAPEVFVLRWLSFARSRTTGANVQLHLSKLECHFRLSTLSKRLNSRLSRLPFNAF